MDSSFLYSCCFDIVEILDRALAVGVVADGMHTSCPVERYGEVASGGKRDDIRPFGDIALSVSVVADRDDMSVLF